MPVSSGDTKELSVLTRAASRDSVEIVQLLLDYGENKRIRMLFNFLFERS